MYAETALAEAREIAKAAENGYTEIALELSSITGDRYERQNVHQWLGQEDPVEPRLGVGLALIEAAKAVKKRLKVMVPKK